METVRIGRPARPMYAWEGVFDTASKTSKNGWRITVVGTAVTNPARRIYELQGGREINDKKYQVICPAHDDSNPSLSVKVGDYGKLLVHCHAGCEYSDIEKALKAEGLNLRQRIRLPSREPASNDGFDKRRAANRITAERAERMWNSAPRAVTHEYLEDRGVRAHGIRIKDGALLIPMRRKPDGRIWNLQQIFCRKGGLVAGGRLNGESKKLFLKDGKTKGLFHEISGDDATIYICEGYADAASILRVNRLHGGYGLFGEQSPRGCRRGLESDPRIRES